MRVSAPVFSGLAQLRALERRIAAEPAELALQFERARCLDDLGRTEEAMHAYRDVLLADPKHFGALTNLGTLFVEQGRPEGASVCFQAAVAAEPNDPLAHLNVAALDASSDAFEAARSRYEHVLQAFPSDTHARVHAHNGLARLYERAGDEERAREHLAAAFEEPVVWTLPHRGPGEPLRVLVLTSPRGGDVVSAQFFDQERMERTVVVPESFRDGRAFPPHHVIFNGIGEADASRPTLEHAAKLVADSAAPVINEPRAVLLTDRRAMMDRLAGVPSLVAPRTRRLPRAEITPDRLDAEGFTFPLLLRSPGFHAGDHFELVRDAGALTGVLAGLPGGELYVIAYHEARGADGWVRKYRVAFIDGRTYPIHLALARQWKVHYFSAEMADVPEHRAEERRYLENIEGVLSGAEMEALAAVAATLGLDYGGVDFGRGPDGRLIVFEANATMAIYPPPDDARWEYRRAAYERAIAGVRAMIVERAVRGGYK